LKTYKNLYQKFITEDNIRLAIKKASIGKRKRKQVLPFIEHTDEHIKEIIDYANNFYNEPHVSHVINERGRGKAREIVVPTFREQIVHHMVVRTLEPIMMKGMYEHSYGSIPGRGIHLAKKRAEKWLRKDRKNTKYFLKMDIRHFFASIPHDKLKTMIGKSVKDERLIKVISTIIDVIPQGLPLGFYTSQWFANWYLQSLDHFIKEQMKAEYYIRYMDDMVVFGASKRKLHKMIPQIQEYLAGLGLELKPDWFVARFVYEDEGKEYGRDLDFMGFRFYRERTTLRRSIMLRTTRLAKRMKRTISNAHRFMSYLGWFDHSDTYNVYLKWIKPFVVVHSIKAQIGRYDRRRFKRCGIKAQTAIV